MIVQCKEEDVEKNGYPQTDRLTEMQHNDPAQYTVLGWVKIKLNAGGHEVKQVSMVKILGFKIQHNLQNSSQVNGLISNLNNRLYNIRKLASNTTIKSRLILTKAIVIGKLNYCLPLLSNATKAQLAKLNTLVTKSCRTIIGNPCLKWSSGRL